MFFIVCDCVESCTASVPETLERTLGERRHVVTVTLEVSPVDEVSSGDACGLTFDEEAERQMSAEMKDAVDNGVQSSYFQGNVGTSSSSNTIMFFPFLLLHFHNCDPAPCPRSVARLPSPGCLHGDPERQTRTRDITSHGVCLCVPLYA